METSVATIAAVFALGLAVGVVAGWKARRAAAKQFKDG